MSYKRYPIAKVRELSELIFKKCGYSQEDAAIITDVLITSDRMGIESHGVQRLTFYPYSIGIQRIKVDGKPQIVRETPVSAVVDAVDIMGQLAGKFAMDLAIQKAKKNGMGMVVVRNSNHFGIAGYYSLMAAKEGFLGIALTNSEALVVPIYGRHPMMGTNPIAISMPAQPYPFHLDMSTSVVTAGKVEVYAKNETPLPEGWSVGRDGNVNTSAKEFLDIRKTKSDGGLLPLGGISEQLGGHKGYGLSLVVELLTGILAEGYTSNLVRVDPRVEKTCHMFGVVDYGMFTDNKAALEARFSDYLNAIRESAKADGQDRIYIHGEKEFFKEEEVIKNGIPINDISYGDIRKTCDELSIDIDAYLPFDSGKVETA